MPKTTLTSCIFILACLSLPACAQDSRPRTVGVRTNLLYDAALIPNVGMEWGIGGGWSMQADGMFIWLSNDRRHRYWRIASADVEVRRLLGSRAPREGIAQNKAVPPLRQP